MPQARARRRRRSTCLGTTARITRSSSPIGTRTTAGLAALLFASGAAGLIYQVAWVRLLGLSFGVTIYAISTVLAAFMGGLAIGSIVGGRRADRLWRPLRAYGLVELGVGLTALATPLAFRWLQDVYAASAQAVDPMQAPLVAGSLRAALAFCV